MEFAPMEARSTKQAHGSKKKIPRLETINLAVYGCLKKNPWVQHKYMQVPKKKHTGSRKHTGMSPTCFVPQVKKNLARSKKHVQVQKKGAQVQKTCIPISTLYFLKGFKDVTGHPY